MVLCLAIIHPEHFPITVLTEEAGPGCSQPPSDLHQAEQPQLRQVCKDETPTCSFRQYTYTLPSSP